MRNLSRTCAVVLLVLMARAPAALAQLDVADIAGEWEHPGPQTGIVSGFQEEQQDRGNGPSLGDLTGLPVNDAGRFRALHYSPSWLSAPENQCLPHPSPYQARSPGGMFIAREYHPATQRLVAYRVYGTWGLTRTIWMDGRPHPPDTAPHTYDGFSTGVWDGHRLIVETTHLKTAFVRRNGAPQSDRARMTEHFVRHDTYLTIITALLDPVYFDGPFVRSTDFKLVAQPRDRLPEFGGVVDGGPGATFYKCSPTDEVGGDRWKVPHYLPGENTEIDKFPQVSGVPAEAARGGRDTLYPEYMRRLRDLVPGRASAASASAQPVASLAVTPGAAERGPRVSSRHVAGQIWMITAAGVNVAVQVGSEGVLVVNPGPAETASAVLAEIRRLAGDKQVRVMINTNPSPENYGGNLEIGAGPTPAAQRATILAHENAALWMVSAGMSGLALPDDVFFRGVREYYFNDEPIRIIHTPSAVTDGDVVVLFRKSDVLVAGDIIDDLAYPVIRLDEGGSVRGTVDALNRLVDLAVAGWRRQGGTWVIPRRGRVYDEGDVAEYRDTLSVISDRLEDAIAKGKTLEQVKAERPTRDYDGRFGATPGPASAEAWLETAYRSLSRAKPAP